MLHTVRVLKLAVAESTLHQNALTFLQVVRQVVAQIRSEDGDFMPLGLLSEVCSVVRRGGNRLDK